MRRVMHSIIAAALVAAPLAAAANPYLAKPGETSVSINRRLVIPANAVAENVEVAREAGVTVKRKPDEIFDNSFAEHLEKSGFLKELWGDLPRGK